MSSSGNTNSPRKGKGRQRVNMVKIENENNLQVTFSKRRAGLFKKASELGTLCGAEVAVVIFSPGNKAHSFGYPSVENVAARFLYNNVTQMTAADKLLEAHHKVCMNQQNVELNQLHEQLELEQKRAQELEKVKKEGQRQRWVPPDLDKLDYQHLDQLKRALLQFRHQLENKLYNATSFADPFVPGPSVNHGTRAPSHGSHGFCNRGKSGVGGPSSRAPSNDGGNTSGASVMIYPRANNPNIQSHDVRTIPYDPMAGDSCPTIPYSSTATSVNPNEH